MTKKVHITKASGEGETFSRAKLMRSLRKAGASHSMAEEVWDLIEPDLEMGMSSSRLSQQAFRHLKRLRRSVAARYQLKKAIMELGPSGYPFERLMGEVFRHRGYEEVEVSKILSGRCVQHEVDVVGNHGGKLLLVECKYRNIPGYKCDVKVPLYIHSRFEDIRHKRNLEPYEVEGWIATNSRFSGDAIQYAECAGLKLIGWDYPEGNGLSDWLDETRLYPLTVLTSISKAQKRYLLEHELILCRDILERPELLRHLPGRQIRHLPHRIMDEVHQLLDS